MIIIRYSITVLIYLIILSSLVLEELDQTSLHEESCLFYFTQFGFHICHKDFYILKRFHQSNDLLLGNNIGGHLVFVLKKVLLLH